LRLVLDFEIGCEIGIGLWGKIKRTLAICIKAV